MPRVWGCFQCGDPESACRELSGCEEEQEPESNRKRKCTHIACGFSCLKKMSHHNLFFYSGY